MDGRSKSTADARMCGPHAAAAVFRPQRCESRPRTNSSPPTRPESGLPARDSTVVTIGAIVSSSARRGFYSFPSSARTLTPRPLRFGLRHLKPWADLRPTRVTWSVCSSSRISKEGRTTRPTPPGGAPRSRPHPRLPSDPRRLRGRRSRAEGPPLLPIWALGE